MSISPFSNQTPEITRNNSPKENLRKPKPTWIEKIGTSKVAAAPREEEKGIDLTTFK